MTAFPGIDEALANSPWIPTPEPGWRPVRLRWTVQASKNGTWGADPDGQGEDLPCVRVADFDRDALRVTAPIPTMRKVELSHRAGRVLQRGDLLFEKSGGGDKQPVGAVVYYDCEERAVCSNFVARLQVANGHHARFLTYVHASLYYARVNTRSIKQTTGIQNIDGHQYLDEVVLLPGYETQRAIADFLDRKTQAIDEVIVEHFRRSTQHKIGGKAKAMVVTGSRLHAVRYKLAFDKYIAEKGYQDVRALVAFSGEVVDKDVPGDPTYTEVGMNNITADRDGLQRFRSEGELPERFASDDFQVLLVANKYQTGFDEPRLHTMYVDKRLHGIQAVQTLSRLNRTCPGKGDTFVLDFVNEREEILASFQDYYEAAHVDETVDPQRLYELQTELDAAQLYLQPEVDRFAAVFFKPGVSKRVQDHAGLNSLLDPAVDRFKHADEEARETFRGQLSAFTKLYAFLAQIVPFADSDLEKLYVFGRLLLTKLPKVGEATPPIRLGDDVALHSYRLQRIADGPLNLAAEGGGPLYGPSETGTGRPNPETEHLSKLIEVVNDRFGTEFTEADQLFFDSVEEHLAQEGALEEAAKANTKADFGIKARQVLQEAFVDRHQSNGSIVERFFSDETFKAAVEEWFVARLYERLRGSDSTNPPRLASIESPKVRGGVT